jgi:hypothetical protein
MTSDDTKPGMAIGDRHVYGPRHVAALVPRVTAAAFRRRAPAAAQIMADWAAIVGPALAAVTTPRGLSAGTLTIACAGPVAMELAHLSDQLSARINGHVGRQTVTRLRFVQTIQPALAQPRVAAPPPQDVARAAAAVADMPDGPLKDALASLGALVLASRPAQKPTVRGPSTGPVVPR